MAGKALAQVAGALGLRTSHHPMNRVVTGPPVPYTSRMSSLFGDSTPVATDAYEAYGCVGTLFAIVDQRINAFASVPWHLFRRMSVRDESRRQEILTHGFLSVWNRPNKFYSGRMFRMTVQQHLDLVGEGVILLNKFGPVIYEMWPVRPDRIQPVKHPTKFLTGYIYKGPDGEDIPLTLDQVIHIKRPNPKDPYRGMGPVQSVLHDIDAAKYSAEWNRNFFVNGAKPGGVIEVDYRMNDNEFNAFLARWNNQHKGVSNAHRVAVLENAKWVDSTFSMSDMQFVELRNLPRELIREAFAFPKPMLGTVDDVNRANAEMGEVIFGRWQIQPICETWKDFVNVFLLPQFQNGSNLIHDYENPVPENREATDRRRDSQAKAWATLVNAGADPNDTADWVGMPRLKFTAPAKKQVTVTGEPKEVEEGAENAFSNFDYIEGEWRVTNG